MKLKHAASLLIGLSLAVGTVPSGWAEDTSNPVDAPITVQQVPGIPNNFSMGVDVSSVLSLEESGVVFKNHDGKPQDLFTILADAGVTDVRVRVWNDPYDSQGRGYGGGNLNVARACEIGKRATAAGLGVLVDFHYSDFWADPGKQKAPKEWQNLSVSQKTDRVRSFTRDALQQFVAAGVDVKMVQVGNETNNAIAGVSGWEDMAKLLNAGSQAVREVLPKAKVALHFTNPERQQYSTIASSLSSQGVDYDVFLSSYYPYWHGSIDNLTSELAKVRESFGVEVGVAETSWAYTLEDGDGHVNTIANTPDSAPYPISVQGQATAVRDVIAATVKAGGVGVYYWEPAWLPVGPPTQLEANKNLWEMHGSGWASSFAAEFDPDDAGQWHGGSAWDNQALFDFSGTPLDSLNVFKYVKTGAVAPRTVLMVEPITIAVTEGEPIVLPTTVTVKFSDGSAEQRAVRWSALPQGSNKRGTYTIEGTADGDLKTTAKITVEGANYLRNPGFEDGDTSAWTTTGSGLTLHAADDPHSGERSAHFWSEGPFTFTLNQQVINLPKGDYIATASIQGGPQGALSADNFIRIRITDGRTSQVADFTLNGWREWSTQTTSPFQLPAGGTLSVIIEANLPAGAWGTIDDLSLVAVTSPETPDERVDTTELTRLIEQAEHITKTRYSAKSIADLDDALTFAKKILSDESATQTEVDAAVERLRTAIEKLELITETEIPVPAPNPSPRSETPSSSPKLRQEREPSRPGLPNTGA